MKRLHYGLLAAGATVAAGLAIVMTQPPSIPADDPAPQPARSIIPAAATAAKPTPMPRPALSSPAPVVLSPTSSPTVAPEPVYDEPRQAIRENELARKKEPVVIAKAIPPMRIPPTQWTPAPYQEPTRPVAPPTEVAPALQPPQIEQAPVPDSLPAPSLSAPPATSPALRRVTLQIGMAIPVRVDEWLSSEKSAAGDTFEASLAEPLVVRGLVIAEKGARVTGIVVDSHRAGRAGNSSMLKLELSKLSTSDGQRIAISTDPWTRRGEASLGEDAGRIGGGAAVGAIIGAIVGGGQGAAIGAGIGGTAGAGSILATRGRPATVPSETIIRFRLATRVTITEQQLADR